MDFTKEAARRLLNFIADHNGNVYSEFNSRLNLGDKKKLNQLVKNLFNQINTPCPQTNSNKQSP